MTIASGYDSNRWASHQVDIAALGRQPVLTGAGEYVHDREARRMDPQQGPGALVGPGSVLWRCVEKPVAREVHVTSVAVNTRRHANPCLYLESVRIDAVVSIGRRGAGEKRNSEGGAGEKRNSEGIETRAI